MVVILAERLSSVGKEKVESKNFCLYYRQILQKIQTYSHPIFSFFLFNFYLIYALHFTSLDARKEKHHKTTFTSSLKHTPLRPSETSGRCPLTFIKLFSKNILG